MGGAPSDAWSAAVEGVRATGADSWGGGAGGEEEAWDELGRKRNVHQGDPGGALKDPGQAGAVGSAATPALGRTMPTLETRTSIWISWG